MFIVLNVFYVIRNGHFSILLILCKCKQYYLLRTRFINC